MEFKGIRPEVVFCKQDMLNPSQIEDFQVPSGVLHFRAALDNVPSQEKLTDT